MVYFAMEIVFVGFSKTLVNAQPHHNRDLMLGFVVRLNDTCEVIIMLKAICVGFSGYVEVIFIL